MAKDRRLSLYRLKIQTKANIVSAVQVCDSRLRTYGDGDRGSKGECLYGSGQQRRGDDGLGGRENAWSLIFLLYFYIIRLRVSS